MNNEDKIITEKAEYLATTAGAQAEAIRAAIAASPRPIPTGLANVDRMLDGGFDYGKLYVLASAPGMGKTTLALQMAANISANGSNVIYISLVDDERTLTLKGVSRCSKEFCDADGLTRWKLTQEDREDCRAYVSDRQRATMKQAWGYYYEQAARLKFIDYPTSMDDLERIVDRHEQRLTGLLTGNTPFVVVDYLQHLRPCDYQKGWSISDQCEENVMRLKTLALQHRIPMLVLSSISRSSYYVKVSAESLNDAGGIEYAADVVLGLQPMEYSSNDKIAGKREMEETMKKAVRDMSLSCVKNRDGGLGEVALRYHAAYNFFEEMK